MEELKDCSATGSNNIIAGAGASVILQNFRENGEQFDQIGFLLNEMNTSWSSSVTELKSLFMNNNDLNKNRQDNKIPSIVQGDHSTVINITNTGDGDVYSGTDCKDHQETIDALKEEIQLLKEMLALCRQEKNNNKSK